MNTNSATALSRRERALRNLGHFSKEEIDCRICGGGRARLRACDGDAYPRTSDWRAESEDLQEQCSALGAIEHVHLRCSKCRNSWIEVIDMDRLNEVRASLPAQIEEARETEAQVQAIWDSSTSR